MIDERFQVEILRASRNRLYNLIEATTADILFKIPDGFNNNNNVANWSLYHLSTKAYVYAERVTHAHI